MSTGLPRRWCGGSWLPPAGWAGCSFQCMAAVTGPHCFRRRKVDPVRSVADVQWARLPSLQRQRPGDQGLSVGVDAGTIEWQDHGRVPAGRAATRPQAGRFDRRSQPGSVTELHRIIATPSECGFPAASQGRFSSADRGRQQGQASYANSVPTRDLESVSCCGRRSFDQEGVAGHCRPVVSETALGGFAPVDAHAGPAFRMPKINGPSPGSLQFRISIRQRA